MGPWPYTLPDILRKMQELYQQEQEAEAKRLLEMMMTKKAPGFGYDMPPVKQFQMQGKKFRQPDYPLGAVETGKGNLPPRNWLDTWM